MIRSLYQRIQSSLDSNQIPLLVFFSSLFIFISFAGTRLFLSDDGVILDQFYNLINGSLALKIAKISTAKGVFILVGNNLYGIFSYSLLFLALPVFYVLGAIDSIYGAHLFLLILWAFSGGFTVYLIAKIRNLKYAVIAGAAAFFMLTAANLYYFKPIYFSMWGELLSLEFTNIFISSLLVLVVYLLFKKFFGIKIGIFASFFIIFATPISFYAITLKHHTLAIFLTLLAFYLFHEYTEKKDNKFIYFAYLSAGLVIWTRILDGAVLMASLLIADVLLFKRGIKHIAIIFAVIIISLAPFLSFNYLILGDPFSIIETIPLADRPVTLSAAEDFISLDESPFQTRQIELLNELGYRWNTKIRTDLVGILMNIMILKSVNTSGIFLVSPFLITAIAFPLYRLKNRIKLNTMEKFLALYIVLLIAAYVNHLASIIIDTPAVLEYRYLLILYVVLLYFALRVDNVRQAVECNLKKIVFLYGIILISALIYCIYRFPLPFLSVYDQVALITSASLITVLSMRLFITEKKLGTSLDKSLVYLIALSFALSSCLLIFYYWVVSMTYISPSQNHAIIPIMENILRWMYEIVFTF